MPYTDCAYETEEVGEGLAVEFKRLHAAVHSAPYLFMARTKSQRDQI